MGCPNDFHNFYKYELSADDAECMTFLLTDYFLEQDISYIYENGRRIQDFVFLLLRRGFTENQTLNVLIESLYFIPRVDILYECSIDYKHLNGFMFGKFLNRQRVLLFKLYNECTEDEFQRAFSIVYKSKKFSTSVLQRMNNLYQDKIRSSKNLIKDELIQYFAKYGNSKTESIVKYYRDYVIEEHENRNELYQNGMVRNKVSENEVIPLAMEKGDDRTNPNFLINKNGKVRVLSYKPDECYTVPDIEDVKSLCLIFDIKNYANNPRKGSEKDISRIRKTFTELHFTIQLYEDVSKEDMFDIASRYAQIESDKIGSMLVCFILAHGCKDCIYDINEETVNIRNFSLVFSAKNCQALINKPKIFFIQACQGDRYHEGIPESVPNSTLSNQFQALQLEDSGHKLLLKEYKQSDIIPEEADFIFGMATVADYVAFRSTKKGSWYIKELCDRISEFARKKDVVEILMNVNFGVSKKNYRNSFQLPSVMFTTRKKCYLAPQDNA